MVKNCKECPICKETKDRTLYYKTSRYCKDCQKQYSQKTYHKNPSIQRDRDLKSKYGISLIEFKEMVADQNGHCALCPSTKRLSVDHCHETGRVRGILCMACNVALGQFKDDTARLARAILYLQA